MRKDRSLAVYRNKYPSELVGEFVQYGHVKWDTLKRHDFCIASAKINVELTCLLCQERRLFNTKALQKRVYLEQICSQCSLKYATNHPDWRKKNSQAQLKVQSTPEQKRKNSEGLKRHHRENPDTAKKIAKSMEVRHKDPEYRKKWESSCADKNFHALSGKLLGSNGWISFGSSYELCFLVYAQTRKDWTIRRCDFHISYDHNGNERRYYPDFVVLTNDLKKCLVEVKSTQYRFYDSEKQKCKDIAVKKKMEQGHFDEYWFIDENHPLAPEINFRRTTKIKSLCKSLHVLGLLELENEKQRKSYLGWTLDGKGDKAQ